LPKRCRFQLRERNALPAELAELIGPMVNQVQALNQPIDKLDQQVEALVQRYPEIRTLRTVPGVGPLVAATYVLTLHGANAVPHSRSAGALGLGPRKKQSGDSDPQCKITRGPATPTCDRSWCSRRITCWGTSGRIRLSGGGDASLRPAAASAVRNEPWWLWLVNWPWSCTACGTPASPIMPSRKGSWQHPVKPNGFDEAR
jgi:hypothetical protein